MVPASSVGCPSLNQLGTGCEISHKTNTFPKGVGWGLFCAYHSTAFIPPNRILGNEVNVLIGMHLPALSGNLHLVVSNYLCLPLLFCLVLSPSLKMINVAALLEQSPCGFRMSIFVTKKTVNSLCIKIQH